MNTNYEKDFVPYEQALALKELGFDEPCFGFYTYKGGIRRYTNFDGELNDFQTLKNSSIIMGNGCVGSLSPFFLSIGAGQSPYPCT